MKGQKILVTGGLGFIGSNLVHRCLELGAQVTVYDILDPRSGGNWHNVRDIEDSLQIVVNDIRHFEAVSAVVRKQDIVFNCAAYTSHPNSMREPLVDIDVNCKGVVNLLEAVRRFNPEVKFVHIGTSTQIGKMLYSPVDEKHPEFPIDFYSADKSASEKYTLIYHNAYHLRATAVRLANVYGPRSSIKSSEFGFVNYFIGLALQRKDLTVFGEGAQLRNLCYVEDCIEALMQAAQQPESDGQVFFAVADRQYRVLEITQAIVQHIGGRIRFVEWPKDRAAIEVGDAVISNEKIKAMLHWTPRYDLDSGLNKTQAFFRPRLQHYL